MTKPLQIIEHRPCEFTVGRLRRMLYDAYVEIGGLRIRRLHSNPADGSEARTRREEWHAGLGGGAYGVAAHATNYGERSGAFSGWQATASWGPPGAPFANREEALRALPQILLEDANARVIDASMALTQAAEVANAVARAVYDQ